MKRLLSLFAALLLALPAPAFAWYKPLPTPQAVDVGANTLVQYGGIDASALGFTLQGVPTIASTTRANADTVKWSFDASNRLILCAATNTTCTAAGTTAVAALTSCPAPPAACYTLHLTGAGWAHDVAIVVPQNRNDIRWTATDSTNSSQLRTLLQSSSLLVEGQTVMIRDGIPNNAIGTLGTGANPGDLWTIKPVTRDPTMGRITVRCEHSAPGTDPQNGQPNEGGYCFSGPLSLANANGQTDQDWDLDFQYINFYVGCPQGGVKCIAGTLGLINKLLISGSGWDTTVTHSYFSLGSDVTNVSDFEGWSDSYNGCYAGTAPTPSCPNAAYLASYPTDTSDCDLTKLVSHITCASYDRFENIGIGLQILSGVQNFSNNSVFSDWVVCHNIQYSDCFDVSPTPHTYLAHFFDYDHFSTKAEHPDAIQWWPSSRYSSPPGTWDTAGTYFANVAARGSLDFMCCQVAGVSVVQGGSGYVASSFQTDGDNHYISGISTTGPCRGAEFFVGVNAMGQIVSATPEVNFGENCHIGDVVTLTVSNSYAHLTSSQAVGPFNITVGISGTTMTVTSSPGSNVLTKGMLLGSPATAGTYIVSQSSGTPGGNGAYVVNASQTVTPGTVVTAKGWAWWLTSNGAWATSGFHTAAAGETPDPVLCATCATLMVTSVGPTPADAEGDPFHSQTGTDFFSGTTLINNIGIITFGNGGLISDLMGPTVHNNDYLYAAEVVGNPPLSNTTATVTQNFTPQGDGGDFSRNFTNKLIPGFKATFAAPNCYPIVSCANSPITLYTVTTGAYQAAAPGYPSGAYAFDTRAKVIAALAAANVAVGTPTAPVGLVAGDGSVVGSAVKDLNGAYCWANENAFNFALSCAANGFKVADSPGDYPPM